MKIVLATGIFPSEIGGPATIVEQLAGGLARSGFEIAVGTYTSNHHAGNQQSRNYPGYPIYRKNVFFNYLKYFLTLYRLVRPGDIIFAFDALSAGLPSALVGLLKGNRLVIRLGGDFLWEKLFNEGRTELAMPDFYQAKNNYSGSFRFKIIKWVLKQAAKVVLTNQWFFDVIGRPYGLAEKKVTIINNPFPPVSEKHRSGSNLAIAAGRFIRTKRFKELIKIFSEIKNQNARLVIYGSGPLAAELKSAANFKIEIKDSISQSALAEKIAASRFYIQSSISEVSPNTVLQALAVGTPVLMSNDGGYADWLKDKVEIYNFADLSDLQDKIEKMYQPDYYQKAEERLATLDKNYFWKDVLTKYLGLIKVL